MKGQSEINSAKETLERRIGKNLRFIREFFHIRQEEFGKQFHVSQQLVSRYERGSAVPPHDYLARVSQVFHVSLDAIYKKDVGREDFSPESKMEIEYKSMLYPEYDDSYQHRERLLRFEERVMYGYYINTAPEKNDIRMMNIAFKRMSALGFLSGFVKTESNRVYRAKLVIPHGNYAYIYLDALNEKRERALIIFHYSLGAKKPYCGGMGFILSLSSGEECIPCGQKIVISDLMLEDKAYLIRLLKFDTMHDGNKAFSRKNEDYEVYQYIKAMHMKDSVLKSVAWEEESGC